MGKTNKQIADEIRREASNIWDGHDGEKCRIARSTPSAPLPPLLYFS